MAVHLDHIHVKVEHQGHRVNSGRSRISRWGALTHWGGANLRRVHFSAKMYVKTKEIDPVGGACTMAPPRSANGQGQGQGHLRKIDYSDCWTPNYFAITNLWY